LEANKTNPTFETIFFSKEDKREKRLFTYAIPPRGASFRRRVYEYPPPVVIRGRQGGRGFAAENISAGKKPERLACGEVRFQTGGAQRRPMAAPIQMYRSRMILSVK
jgi:hypothetical protein